MPPKSLSPLAQAIYKSITGGQSPADFHADHPEYRIEQLNAAAREIIEMVRASGITEDDLAPSKPSKKSTAAPALDYQIKITLRNVKPPVWRRFIVPGEIRLDQLHDVIQYVMGWHDCHLHSFEIAGRSYTMPHPDIDTDGYDERKFRLCDLIDAPKSKFEYEYDFGDDWRHTLVIEKILPADKSAPRRATCTAGARACPPEDCGGPWGYTEFLAAYTNPKHAEHESMLEWAGEGFDPAQFDPAATSKSLAAIKIAKSK